MARPEGAVGLLLLGLLGVLVATVMTLLLVSWGAASTPRHCPNGPSGRACVERLAR